MNFNYTKINIANLSAARYTVVNIVVDISGSVKKFSDDLKQALIKATNGCKGSPASDNILWRITLFGAGNILEYQPTIPLADVQTSNFPDLACFGRTPLFDSIAESVNAVTESVHFLHKEEYEANGLCLIITDGIDSGDGITIESLKSDWMPKLGSASTEVILVGVNTKEVITGTTTIGELLAGVQSELGISKYEDLGNLDSDKKFAKLIGVIEESVKVASQSVLNQTSTF